ncbi:MAG: methionine biosynthesis protein MetW [Actinomycetota bacterium]|nr:methionine biosynthesis protein MetW [Actinomycetota bacterium]
MDEGRASGTGNEAFEPQSENSRDISIPDNEGATGTHRLSLFNDWELMGNLRFTNALYDRSMPGKPVSKRKIFGPFFMLAKRVIVRVFGWYINPIVENQREFNAYATRTLNEIKLYLDHLQINEDVLGTVVSRDLALFRANIAYMTKSLETRMASFEREIERKGREVSGELKVNEGSISSEKEFVDLLTAIQKIEGSSPAKKERQKRFLKLFRKGSTVAVAGCGRGELLELFESDGIHVTGSETSDVLVEYCVDKSLDVVTCEPVEFIESKKDSSLDGIVLERFIGSKSPSEVMRMLGICCNKLKDNGILLVEAVHPFSAYFASTVIGDRASFIYPVHPETLKVLCSAYDFNETKVIYLDSGGEKNLFESLEIEKMSSLVGKEELGIFRRIEENFAVINELLSSHGNYALFAKRLPREAPYSENKDI